MLPSSTPEARRTLLVLWHSRTGAAQQLAEAAVKGAHAAAQEMEESQHLDVQLCRADSVSADDLLAADGYVFCAPENLGSLSGAMKECLDRNYYALLDAVAGRPYVALIAAGTDGAGALRQLERILTGWRLQPLADGMIHRNGAQTPEAIAAPKQVPAEDLAVAEERGGRVAATLLLQGG